jgi:hypothetical protein
MGLLSPRVDGHEYYAGGQIKESEVDGECSTYGRKERCIQSFGGENWGKESTWKPQA